jgi:hypothetical protein
MFVPMQGSGGVVVHRYLVWGAVFAGILIVLMGLVAYLATS